MKNSTIISNLLKVYFFQVMENVLFVTHMYVHVLLYEFVMSVIMAHIKEDVWYVVVQEFLMLTTAKSAPLWKKM